MDGTPSSCPRAAHAQRPRSSGETLARLVLQSSEAVLLQLLDPARDA
ncbi:hypothetical protein [Blastococcus mobilis]|nr:hypothetical protein [Blastococcus mobilis]